MVGAVIVLKQRPPTALVRLPPANTSGRACCGGFDTLVIINSSLEETPGLGRTGPSRGGYVSVSMVGTRRSAVLNKSPATTASAAGVSFKTPAARPLTMWSWSSVRTRIAVVTVYVTDQDKAKAFYSEALGFKVKDDQPYGPGFRWLTVVSPMDPSTELYRRTKIATRARTCEGYLTKPAHRR